MSTPGNAAGGFGQGFASGLATFLPMAQQFSQQRDELDFRKRMTDAQMKQMDLQAELVQRKMKSGELLRESMLATAPTGDLGYGMATGEQPRAHTMELPPALSGMRGMLAQMAPTDPDAVMRHIIEAGSKPPRTGKPGEAILSANGDVRGYIPYQPGQSPAELQDRGLKFFMTEQFAPEGAATPPPSAALTAPGAAPTAAVATAAAPPVRAPRSSFLRNVTMNKDGSLTYSLQEQRTTLQVGTELIGEPGTGRGILVERVFDPSTGAVVARNPIAYAPSPEFLQRAGAIASSLGLAPGTEAHSRATAEVAAISQLPADLQAQRLADLQEWAATQTTSTRTGPGGASSITAPPSLRSSMDRQRASLLSGKRAEEEMKADVELKTKTLDGDAAKKYENMLSVVRSGDRALELYRPQFVGKGFTAFSQEFQKHAEVARQHKYNGEMPGAVAGSIREFFGNISREEVEFRRVVLDLADQLLRARSGAAITEGEFQRLSALIGRMTDEPTVFLPALQRFVREAKTQLGDIRRVRTTPASKLGEPDLTNPPIPPGFRRESLPPLPPGGRWEPASR